MRISTPNFQDGSSIPNRFTCDGEGFSPELNFMDVPINTVSLAFIMEDPDAPAGLFTHWIIWNMPADTRVIRENNPPIGVVFGKNSAMNNNYTPPCPPDGKHRYFFRLYALDTTLELETGADREDLLRAMEGHVMEEAELMGTYVRDDRQ